MLAAVLSMVVDHTRRPCSGLASVTPVPKRLEQEFWRDTWSPLREANSGREYYAAGVLCLAGLLRLALLSDRLLEPSAL